MDQNQPDPRKRTNQHRNPGQDPQRNEGNRGGSPRFDNRRGGETRGSGSRPDNRRDTRSASPRDESAKPYFRSTPAFDTRRELSPIMKRMVRLKTEKGRLEYSQFLVEGLKPIQDILKLNPNLIEEIFTSKEDLTPQIENSFRIHNKRITLLENWEIRQLCDVQSPQGFIARALFNNLRPDYTKAHRVTILDGVQDPGNVGAIFRTSVALGMDAMILGKGTCDVYNSKVVRASVGYFMQMPFEVGVDLESKIQFLRQKGFTLIATSSRSAYNLDQVKLRKKVAIIFGNEGSGVSDRIEAMADHIVKIPLVNQAESLNVAVSHGILSYHLNNLMPIGRTI